MPPKKETSSIECYPLRLDPELMAAVEELARRHKVTKKTVIETALNDLILRATASQNDEVLAPLIDQVLTERHQQLHANLRTLMMRQVLEIMRLQYLFGTFLERVGVTPDEIRRWRQDGWPWGYREFRRQPKLPPEEPGA